MYEPNMVLCTLDGQRCSNAVVVSVNETTVTVMSDFGNVMRLSIEEVKRYYEPSEKCLEHLHFGGEYPSVKERITQQIELLSSVLAGEKSL